MKKDLIIEIYAEDNVIVIKDLKGNSLQIENPKNLTIQECIRRFKGE